MSQVFEIRASDSQVIVGSGDKPAKTTARVVNVSDEEVISDISFEVDSPHGVDVEVSKTLKENGILRYVHNVSFYPDEGRGHAVYIHVSHEDLEEDNGSIELVLLYEGEVCDTTKIDYEV